MGSVRESLEVSDGEDTVGDFTGVLPGVLCTDFVEKVLVDTVVTVVSFVVLRLTPRVLYMGVHVSRNILRPTLYLRNLECHESKVI